MYKEFVIIITIIILIVVLDLITNNFTKNTVDMFESELYQLNISLEEKDKNEAINQINTIQNKWKEKYDKLAFYLEHDELEKIGTEFTKLASYINTEEYEEAINQLETVNFILKHIEDKEKFSIQSVF